MNNYLQIQEDTADMESRREWTRNRNMCKRQPKSGNNFNKNKRYIEID